MPLLKSADKRNAQATKTGSVVISLITALAMLLCISVYQLGAVMQAVHSTPFPPFASLHPPPSHRLKSNSDRHDEVRAAPPARWPTPDRPTISQHRSNTDRAAGTAAKRPSVGECTAPMANWTDSEAAASDPFYMNLAARADLLQPASFPLRHSFLCDATGFERRRRQWSYCLPISARSDLPYCSRPDRIDLLSMAAGSPATPTSIPCYGSVLHLLLTDVYTEMQAAQMHPALLFGSMLGAIRNSSIIPHTPDADIGYQFQFRSDIRKFDLLRDALWQRGYHLFISDIVRVCMAPTHPLSAMLYDDSLSSTQLRERVPYVDLYQMHPVDRGTFWAIDKIKDNRRVPAELFQPYTRVHVNGLAFDTLADPVHFLEHEYGPEWVVPQVRR